VKIIVCMKQVPDTEARLRIAPDGKTIDRSELKYVMNPYDEFAIEEALRIREAKGGTVTAVCLAPDRARIALRDALAMGADDGLLVKETREHRDAWSTARILADVLRTLQPFDLAFFGRQAVDLDNWQTPIRVAEILDLPCVTAVAKFEVGDGRVVAHRNVEGGREIVEAPMPVVISADEMLNEPRYASLKGIMAAKKKTIQEIDAAAYDDKVEIVGLRPRPERTGGRVVGEGPDAVTELVKLLREEAKIL
jgi:electron transfer flavoprotein beta subunit